MPVRLKDYGTQKQEEEPKKKGPVRLSDIASPKANAAPKADAKPRDNSSQKFVDDLYAGTKALANPQKKVEPAASVKPKVKIPASSSLSTVLKTRDTLKKANEATKGKNYPLPTKDKVSRTIKGIGQGLADFPDAFTDTMSFGLTDAFARKVGVETKAEQEARNNRTGGKIGHYAGYVAPGGVADATANLLVRPLIKNAPAAVKGLVRLGTGGALFQTADEARQALSGENKQTLGERAKDVGIAGGIGGLTGVAGPLIRSGLNKGRDIVGKTLAQTVGALDEVGRSGLPQTSRRGATAARSPLFARPSLNAADTAADSSSAIGRVQPAGPTGVIDGQLHKLQQTYSDMSHRYSKLLETDPEGRSKAFKAIEKERDKVGDEMDRLEALKASEIPVRAAQIATNETAAGTTVNGPVRLAHYNPTEPVTPEGTVSRERGNYRNQRENGSFSDEFNQGLNDRGTSYPPITNAETVAKANENVKNLTGAEATFLGNREYSAEHVATGYRLLQELDRAGRLETNPALRKELTERALNVSEKLAADLTQGGQTIQAASLLKRLSPEGQLMHLQREAKKVGKEVSVADADMYRTLAKDVQQSSASGSQTAEFLDILDRLKAGKPVSADEMKRASLMLEDANSLVNPGKLANAPTKLPDEFKDARKRDKIISFLEEAEQAALARIRARKGDLNSLPLGEWSDHAIVVASQIAKGTIKAATYTEDMVKLFGDSIKPHAKDIYNHAHKMITGTSKNISEGKLDKAKDAFRRLSGQAAAEKEVVKQMAQHVKKVITDAKAGNITPEDIQKIRDFADEIAEFPISSKLPSDEQKHLQNVKALAKNIADVEQQKIPASEATREVSTLLRQVTKLTAEEGGQAAAQTVDSLALRNLAHDLLEKTRPVLKPQTVAEKVAEKFIKEGNISLDDVTTLRELAKQVNELKGAKGMQADMKMQQILNSYEKSSVGGKISTVRYMSMLLNTSTQAVNAVSGPMMMTYHQMLDVIATPFDLVYSKAFNKPRSTTWKQGPGAFDNLFTPIADWFKGLKVGGKAGWQGVDPEGIASQHDIRGLSFKSKLNPLGLAERTLGAVAKAPDYATYSATKNIELRKLAYLDATNSGIKGKQNIREYMDKYLASPDAKGMEQASRIGKKITFQNTDGLAGKSAIAARGINALTGSKDLGVANAIVPFIRTPLNIAITGVENTPAGVLKGLFEINRLRNGADDISKREILKTFVSATAGGTAILGGLGYILSNLGIVSGDNSTNTEVRGLQEAIGKGKFRFNSTAFGRMFDALLHGDADKIREVSKYRKGDDQFDYNRLQPLAFPFAAGATLAEQRTVARLARARGERYPLLKQVGAAASSAGSSLYGMSSLQGLTNTFRTDYNSKTPQYAQILQNVAESFIKGFSPSTLAQEARRQDPIQREVAFNKTIGEDVGTYFKSRFPGQSQSLPPKITTLGDTKQNAPGIKGQYVNPLRSEKAIYNDAAEIIMGLIDRTGDEKLAPTAMSKDVEGKTRQGVRTKIKLTPQRYAKLQEDVGKQIAAKVSALPTHMSDEKLAEKIEELYKTVRETEREKLKKELSIHW